MNATTEQNEAMAAQNGASNGTTETAEQKEEKARIKPYFNAFNMTTIEIDRRIDGWQKDENTDPLVKDAVVHALVSLRDQFVIPNRDEDRSTTQSAGKHYVGVRADGSCCHFQSVSTPTPAKFAQYKEVRGPYHTDRGADHRVEKGIKIDDPRVFLRDAK